MSFFKPLFFVSSSSSSPSITTLESSRESPPSYIVIVRSMLKAKLISYILLTLPFKQKHSITVEDLKSFFLEACNDLQISGSTITELDLTQYSLLGMHKKLLANSFFKSIFVQPTNYTFTDKLVSKRAILFECSMVIDFC